MPEQEGANLKALSDLCTPWCVHVVATLRIADHIAAGVDEISDLAAAAGCDPYALHRVLTQHRTVAEFRELAREAGLEVLAAQRQPSGYFVVECRPS